MYSFKRLSIFALATCLAACASQPIEHVITKTKHVVIEPDAMYTQATAVPKPNPKQTYTSTQVPDFEALYKDQVLLNIELYKSVKMCNDDKAGIIKDLSIKRKQYE